MIKSRVSLKDIAQRVGVSMVTVSAALNGNGRVGSDLARKIREIAREMGYRPNAAAQILKSSPKDLGLLILEKTELIRSNASIQDAMIQFMRISQERFRRCQMEWLDSSRYPNQLPHMLTDGLVGGVICYGHAENAVADFLAKSPSIPVVRLHEPGTYCVDSDMKEGIRRTIHYLFESGHRRIGMINGKNFHVYRQAKEGFELAMKELNLKTPPPFYRENEPFGNYPTEIHDLADSVLSLGPNRPTALLIDCAPIARELLHRLQQKGVNVPDDMSIVSFSNIDWEAKSSIPAISGLEYSYYNIIASAMDLLQDLMEHREPERKKISIIPDLNIRDSIKHFTPVTKKKEISDETLQGKIRSGAPNPGTVRIR